MDTARCESSKSDVDQRFKDLLEASSLGTPAAHRIRCSAPADIVEDVRLRVMERGSPQILPGHAASIQVLPAAAGHDAQLAAGQPQAQEPGSASELENLAAAAQVKTSRRETAEALADAPSDRARHLITTFGILGSAAIAVFILPIGTLNAFHVLALALSALTLGLAVYAGSRLRAIHPPAPRRRAAVLLAAILLVAGAGGLAFNLPRHGGASEQLAGSHTQVTKELAAETAARKRAVTWILGQVSRAAVVSCDPQVCGDLVSAGFPSANVLTLGPGSNDPLGSALVVATEPVRAHFGSRLASVYAPAVIASFGSKTARIDIRLVYPGGAVAYDADERTALPDRKTAGAQLLANSNIRASATARAQLLSGDVDPRLPQLLAIMAGKHPVSIVNFVSQPHGGGPASLLRSADLATVDSAAHMTRSAYLGWMQTFIDAQRAQYHPSVQQVPLHTGQTVLRIGFGAPSPLS